MLPSGNTAAPPRKRTPEQLQASVLRAIKLEKEALVDLSAGRLDDVERKLKSSANTLRGAAGSAALDSRMGAAPANLRHAATKDGVAVVALPRRRERGRVRAKINEAIVLKERALKKIQSFIAPPNQAPQVTEYSSTFVQESYTTFYVIKASDPDGDRLTYAWVKDNQSYCGAFSYTGPRAQWYHPHEGAPVAGANCPQEPVHPGMITTLVTDGHWECFIHNPFGSEDIPFDPFDPDEKCTRKK